MKLVGFRNRSDPGRVGGSYPSGPPGAAGLPGRSIGLRQFLPQLIDLVWNGKIYPVQAFDLRLPLDEVAEGYRAMDERRAIKTLLRP